MNLSTVQMSTLAELSTSQPSEKKLRSKDTRYQRYEMSVIKWPFGLEIEKNLKPEVHVFRHHRSVQEPDVL